MRRPSRPIAIIAAAAVLAFVLLCGVLAAVRPVMTQQAIEQRAVTIAKTEYSGVVTSVTSRRMLQGPTLCSRWEQAATRIMYIVRLQSWDNCDPNQVMWDVQLAGEFHWPGGGMSRVMNMTLVGNGDAISGSGQLVEEAQP